MADGQPSVGDSLRLRSLYPFVLAAFAHIPRPDRGRTRVLSPAMLFNATLIVEAEADPEREPLVKARGGWAAAPRAAATPATVSA